MQLNTEQKHAHPEITPNSHWRTALQNVFQNVEKQDNTGPCLYILATPIGNLADITVRGLYLLQEAEMLACEDTRVTHRLLLAYGISRTKQSVYAIHQYNETEGAQRVLQALAEGQRVVYVSDAGTPGVSDPGCKLVAIVQQAGYRVSPLPGPSSVTALLSVSGAGGEDGAFRFVGFIPAKGQSRSRALQALAEDTDASLLLEAPHRIAQLAQDLAVFGARKVTVGRELTKQFEQIWSGPCAEFPQWLIQDPHHSKGEFVLLLHPQQQGLSEDALWAQGLRVLTLLEAQGIHGKTAIMLSAQITGLPRNLLYQKYLEIQNEKCGSDADGSAEKG